MQGSVEPSYFEGLSRQRKTVLVETPSCNLYAKTSWLQSTITGDLQDHCKVHVSWLAGNSASRQQMVLMEPLTSSSWVAVTILSLQFDWTIPSDSPSPSAMADWQSRRLFKPLNQISKSRRSTTLSSALLRLWLSAQDQLPPLAIRHCWWICLSNQSGVQLHR